MPLWPFSHYPPKIFEKEEKPTTITPQLEPFRLSQNQLSTSAASQTSSRLSWTRAHQVVLLESSVCFQGQSIQLPRLNPFSSFPPYPASGTRLKGSQTTSTKAYSFCICRARIFIFALSEYFEVGFILVDDRSKYTFGSSIDNSPCTVLKIFLKQFKSLLSKEIFY